jgi:small conductance mechanosensitive channel
MLEQFTSEESLQQIVDLTVEYAPKVVLAVFTLLIGLWVIGIVTKMFGRVLKMKELDESLQGFFLSLASIGLKVLLVISVAGMIGIEVTSFIAILGAVSLSIGMALSGTLQNFAGGVMILIFRPFKVGDFIEAQGFAGVVSEIQIFNTIMKTGDNKVIIIPNAPLSSGSLTNYSREPKRRVDFTFGIGYNDDIDHAKGVLHQLSEEDDRIHGDPAPFIAVSELADSSVNLVLRVWVDAANYWPVKFDMLEKVKKTFDQEGISIPYPQQDVHYHQNG